MVGKPALKKAYETSWDTTHTNVNGASDTNFSSILKMIHWNDAEREAANVKCSEVYGVLPPHEHSADSKGICTVCKELVGGTKIADTVFSQTVASDSNPAAPAGFKSSVKVVAHHNINACVASIDISSYTKLYFAVRAPYNTQYFSGSGKSFWTDRWNYIYLEKVDSTWHAYGRDPGETEFTELTIDSQSNNVKSMFKVVCWDCSIDDFNMFTTELIGL